MPSKSKTDIRQCDSGMTFELQWSDDETVVRLAVYTKDGQLRSIRMTTLQLDELRAFLNDRMQ